MFEKLDDRTIDMLTEVCNVGAGHAATALSQMIGKKVLLEVPRVLLEVRQRAENARASRPSQSL